MACAAPSTGRTRSAGDSASRAIGGPSSAVKRGAARPALAPPNRGRAVFLAGVMVGLADGAATALLLAPRTGAETRQALRRRGRRARTRGSAAWEGPRLELATTARALRREPLHGPTAAEGAAPA